MRVVVLRSENGGHRGRHLADAMVEGFKRHGCRVTIQKQLVGVHGDLVIGYGWRNHVGFEAYRQAGGHFLYLDLGYWMRKPVGSKWEGYHKVVLDAWCPTARMLRGYTSDRFDRLKVPVVDNAARGEAIVVAGMSPKSAAHHGFQFEEWERRVIAQLGLSTRRRIVYRPKPSKDARAAGRPIAGAEFDQSTPFDALLRRAYAVVTHHSNAAVDGIAAGLPVYCEAGVGRLLSVASLDDIDTANPAPADHRRQLLWDVAWQQFTPVEMRRGTCWEHFRGLL